MQRKNLSQTSTNIFPYLILIVNVMSLQYTVIYSLLVMIYFLKVQKSNVGI